MKALIKCTVAFMFLFTVFIGCQAEPESEPVRLVRAMMALDYEQMTVPDFNAAIEKLCEETGTGVPQVYSDVIDEFSVTVDGQWSPAYTDAALQNFMDTTLSYSSVELYARHAGDIAAHMGAVMYITAPGMTAQDIAALSGDAYGDCIADNAESLNIFPILSYYVEGGIPNPGAITVAERDKRVGDAHAAVKAYFLGLSADNAASGTLEANLAAELERISAQYSDDAMTITCVVQSVTREEDLQE